MARAAKAQGVSLNQYVLYLLTKGHGERATGRREPEPAGRVEPGSRRGAGRSE